MKSIKLLVFGNSYSNDALYWLPKVFLSAGYGEVTVGHILNGGCNINHHFFNVDDDPENDYGGGASLSRNGTAVEIFPEGTSLKKKYEMLIAAEPWDIIVIQHGPKDVEKEETYSHLGDLLNFIKARLQSKDTKFVYHMIWKYNDNITEQNRTCVHYDKIIDISKNIVMACGEFSGLIPAATFRENMVSSYLEDKDISRDYGHMGLSFGRYALSLLWFRYLTGEPLEKVTFVPTPDGVSDGLKQQYPNEVLEVKSEDIAVAREAIENAIKTPFKITPSSFTERSNDQINSTSDEEAPPEDERDRL